MPSTLEYEKKQKYILTGWKILIYCVSDMHKYFIWTELKNLARKEVPKISNRND